MRLKIVISVLLAAVAGLAVIFLFKPAGSRPTTEVVVPDVDSAAPATKPQPAVAVIPAKPTAPVVQVTVRPPATATSVVLTPEEAAIKAKLDLLTDLQANYDAESLQAILNELTNTNRLIRHAAIEATTQFRDRAAIPVLQDLANRTTDPEEKQELLDAVEFLTIPTYTEVMAARKKARLEAQGAGQP